MQRNTRQRAAIESAFVKDGPLTVDEILLAGQRIVPTLNLATVYRNLKLLVQQGVLRQLQHPSLGTLYERMMTEHHHHFLCRVCKRAFDIPCDMPHGDYVVPAGYTVEDHEIYLYGLCPDCS